MANAVNLQLGSDAHIRQVVATTLAQWFEKDTVLEAICVVEHLLARADTSNFGVIAIVKALSNHFGWSQQMRHDARLSLYKNMLPEATLVADPEPELACFKRTRRARKMAVNQSKAQPLKKVSSIHNGSASGQERFIVFSQLIYSLRLLVQKHHASDYHVFKELLRDEIRDLNIGSQVEPWIDHVMENVKEGILAISLVEEQMAAIVHAFYNAISETLGPMDADRLLTRAVSATEKIQAAEYFSPKNFL